MSGSGSAESTGGRLSSAFGPFEDRVWLNCAHQGPLPRPAVTAAEAAVADKVAPARIADEAFREVPEQLRGQLSELVGGRPEEIVLGNATSYGLNLLAQGIPLEHGDEVIVVQGDFPATVVPWLALATRGVHVRFIGAQRARVDADVLAAAITPRTRVFCASWVFSFFGHAVDLEALGAVCRERDVVFIVNGSQALGARPLDVGAVPVDAVCSCGFKWLCGPYATGFAWIRASLLDRLEYPQPYWLTMQRGDDLNRELDYTLVEQRDGRGHDVYGTANFLNFSPWSAALEHLASFGIETIADHDQQLVERLLAGLDDERFQLISPRSGAERSSLVLFSHRDRGRNAHIHGALKCAGIDIALRNDNLRVSPHLYNDAGDIDRLLEALDGAA